MTTFLDRCHLWELRIPTLHGYGLPLSDQRECGRFGDATGCLGIVPALDQFEIFDPT